MNYAEGTFNIGGSWVEYFKNKKEFEHVLSNKNHCAGAIEKIVYKGATVYEVTQISEEASGIEIFLSNRAPKYIKDYVNKLYYQ